MKVFRGPATTDWEDESHVHVSTVEPEDLEESLTSNSLIRFNINKESHQRQAVCTVSFEDRDIVPLLRGILNNVWHKQESLSEIKSILRSEELSDSEQLDSIRDICSSL